RRSRSGPLYHHDVALPSVPTRRSSDLYVMHQVSDVHTNSITKAANLDPDRIPVSYPELGNVGPASLPITLSREADVAELRVAHRSEEHTSELQSRVDLVCRLLLVKKQE